MSMEGKVTKIAVSEAVRNRAKEAASLMQKNGQNTLPFPLSQVESDGEVDNMGILSDSPNNMIPLGEITVEGKRYFIGLPLEKK